MIYGLRTVRFGYTHRIPACPAIARAEGHEEDHDDGLLVAHGPTLAVTAFGGEEHYALTCGWTTPGRSNCVIVRSSVDDLVETWTYEGGQDHWPLYLQAFLDVMPPGLARAVREAAEAIGEGPPG